MRQCRVGRVVGYGGGGVVCGLRVLRWKARAARRSRARRLSTMERLRRLITQVEVLSLMHWMRTGNMCFVSLLASRCTVLEWCSILQCQLYAL